MTKKTNPNSNNISRPGGARAFRWLLLLAIAVVAAPSVLTLSGQLPATFRFVSPGVARAVSFESASVHWWSPVELQQVSVRDLTGEDDKDKTPLAVANKVVTDQALWQLALNFGRGVQLSVADPVINLRVVDGETNLERTVARIAGNASGSGESFPMVVNVTNGTIRLLSDGLSGFGDSPSHTTIDGISGRLSTLNSAAIIPEVSLVANVGRPQAIDVSAAAHKQRGIDPRIAAQLDELAGDFPLIPFTEQEMTALRTEESEHTLTIQIPPTEPDSNVRRIAIEARRVNLAEIEPIICRFLPDFVCRGELSCRIQGQFVGTQGVDGIAGRIQLLGESVQIRHVDWTAGEALHFDNLTAQGAAAIAEDGILLDHLRIKSALLDLSGDGEVRQPNGADTDRTSGEVRLNGRVDFASLSRMMPQTLHLNSDVQIRRADLQFSARVEKQTQDTAQTQLEISPPGFRWRIAVQSSPIEAVKGQQALRVDSSVRADATGSLAVGELNVTQAQVTGSFGSLAANPFEGGYDISGKVNPDQLWNDLRQLIDVPRPGFNGDIEIATKLAMLPDHIRLTDLRLNSKDLTADSPSLSIYSNRTLMEMFNGQITLRGYGHAVKTVVAPWHDAAWLASATTVAARLNAAPGELLTLTVAIKPHSSAAGIANAMLVNEARLEAGIAVDAVSNGFVVERGRLDMPGLTADVAGTLTSIDGVLLSNLTVAMEYDLQVISSRFLTGPKQNIQLRGNGRETFQIAGAPAMWTADAVTRHVNRSSLSANMTDRITPLMATGRVTWDGGSVYGLALGPGAVAAQLKDGLIRTEPIQCTIGTGELNAMPQWDLNANHLQLASGSRVENLQVTPELASQWLGYVTPILGDTANVSGTVSCRVNRFDHFIDMPQQSNIQAVLSVGDASAAPGPSLSPLLQVLELVGKRNLSSRQLEFPPQDVPFEMRDGMVLHQGLRFGVAGYQVTSSGGVSIDRRIQLALDIPLDRSTAETRGRTIRLPVSGTVDRPQIDTAGLLQNLGRQQIEKRVGDQLDRGLNKLFDKLR